MEEHGCSQPCSSSAHPLVPGLCHGSGTAHATTCTAECSAYRDTRADRGRGHSSTAGLGEKFALNHPIHPVCVAGTGGPPSTHPPIHPSILQIATDLRLIPEVVTLRFSLLRTSAPLISFAVPGMLGGEAGQAGRGLPLRGPAGPALAGSHGVVFPQTAGYPHGVQPKPWGSGSSYLRLNTSCPLNTSRGVPCGEKRGEGMAGEVAAPYVLHEQGPL